jgi:hypothetical protein
MVEILVQASIAVDCKKPIRAPSLEKVPVGTARVTGSQHVNEKANVLHAVHGGNFDLGWEGKTKKRVYGSQPGSGDNWWMSGAEESFGGAICPSSVPRRHAYKDGNPNGGWTCPDKGEPEPSVPSSPQGNFSETDHGWCVDRAHGPGGWRRGAQSCVEEQKSEAEWSGVAKCSSIDVQQQ